jgi:hypothetical protein
VKIDVRKLLMPKKWGWRFVAFDLRMENGQLCEYYLTFEKLARVMWDTHRIYEKWRQAGVGDKKARRENPGFFLFFYVFLFFFNECKLIEMMLIGPTRVMRWLFCLR